MSNTLTKDMSQALQAAERIYGTLPERPVHLNCKSESIDPSYAAGKAMLCQAKLMAELEEKEISIPFISVIPKADTPLPAIVYLSYEMEIPNKFLPTEEIIDRGYAIFSLCIKDVSDNSPDFKSQITRHISPSRRKRLSPGKIALWAWAALRLLEYVDDLEFVDKKRIIVAGHGMLARSALLASGNSGKCTHVIASCITENPVPFTERSNKSGLTVRDFPYLYSPAFADEPNIDELECLLNLADKKHLLLGFSEESEYIPDYNYIHKIRNSSQASRAFAPQKTQSKIPAFPLRIQEDDLSYHIRRGSDYFSREDWNIYLDFIDKKL